MLALASLHQSNCKPMWADLHILLLVARWHLTAQPFDAELFILDQLGDAWDYWAAASSPAAAGEGPTTTSITPQPTAPRTAWSADPAAGAPDGAQGSSGTAGGSGSGAVSQPVAVNLVVVAGKKMEAFRKGETQQMC